MILKLLFTASLLDGQYQRDGVKDKPASLLVVSMGKTLSGIPPPWRGRQVVATPKRAGYSVWIAIS